MRETFITLLDELDGSRERPSATRVFMLALLRTLKESEDRADTLRFLIEYNRRDLS
jgi:hypothetical protein